MSHTIQLFFLVTLVAASILAVLPRSKFSVWALRLAIFAALLAVADGFINMLRWQMVPAYLLTLLLVLVTFLRQKKATVSYTRVWLRRLAFGTATTVGALWLMIAVLLPTAFPMFNAPAPIGPYGVGLMDIYLKDEARAETFTDDPNDRRELMVRAWYPSDIPQNATPEPFLRQAEPVHAIFSRGVNLPQYVFGHLTHIPSHSYLNTPMVTGTEQFPVLVFNHGNSFYASQNAMLMEHLASHGYIVFSIDHPYQASWVEFPDGRVIEYDNDWMNTGETEPEDVADLMQKIGDALFADNYAQYFTLMSEIHAAQPVLNTGVSIWVQDTSFLLDELAKANASRPGNLAAFAGHMDLGSIGIFGMSYGGATAGEFCRRDSRCKAGINMDGAQYGTDSMSIELEQPFMLMNADHRLDMAGSHEVGDGPVPFELNDYVYQQSKSRIYSMTVKGSTHGSYSDFGIMQKLTTWSGLLGSIDGWTMKDILNDYTLAFFDQYLKGEDQPLLDGPSENHPEVLELISRDGKTNNG